MAQPAIEAEPVESGQDMECAPRYEKVSYSKDVATAIAALFDHFVQMETVKGFAVFEDEESEMTVVEVETGSFEEDEWVAFFHEAWAWWRTQPEEWRIQVHMAIW